MRILLVRLSHLGDVVHALPVFHALRVVAPDAELAWAIQPEFADLVQSLPGLSRVVLFERHGGLGSWIRLRRELAAYRADWCIDAQGNLKSAAVAVASGAGRRSGPHRKDWREPLGALVLNDAAPPVEGSRHAVDRALHLGRHLAGLAADWLPGDWLCLSEQERERGHEEWARRLPGTPGDAVIVQLAEPNDVRAWPIDEQRELLLGLQREGVPTLALSGPAEASLGERLAREVPGVQHWVGQQGLRSLAAVLAAAAQGGGRFVGGDSGPMHLASAAGLRVFGLAGPQDPALTGPWPVPGPDSPHVTLQVSPAPDCMPCLSRRCRNARGPVCMSELGAAEVLSALVSP